jgi:hypothetical protein
MKKLIAIISTLSLIGLTVIGCSTDSLSTSSQPQDDDYLTALRDLEAQPCPPAPMPPPSPLTTVSIGNASLVFWPYTGADFSGTPQDPINLIFFGKADPRDIRAALLSLDGDRSALGMPPVPPFNSTWEDAIGDVQTGYSASSKWTGGVVQLACGDYSPARFHLRLFKMGPWTIGNAHFEVMIPGTSDHQVLSWELAEQFVTADFIRSGLLDPNVPIVPTGQINDSPFRTIPAIIYNELPVEMRQLAGGPLGDVTEDVPIQTDGQTMILNLANKVPRVAETRVQDFTLNYDIVAPRPFCSAGPLDYVYIAGPVHLKQTTRLTASGKYDMTFKAEGQLSVTPIDIETGLPSGETLTAYVLETHGSTMTNLHSSASSLKYQRLMPVDAPGAGWLFARLRVDSQGYNGFQLVVECADDPDLMASGDYGSDTMITSAKTLMNPYALGY